MPGIRRETAGRSGEDAVLLYVVCHESLAGEAEEALGHLARSLELEPGQRAGAATAHFDAVRQDPRFAALVR